MLYTNQCVLTISSRVPPVADSIECDIVQIMKAVDIGSKRAIVYKLYGAYLLDFVLCLISSLSFLIC